MTGYFISQLIAAGIIGLLIGGFLNIAIYRLPIMLQNSWRAQCQDYLDLPKETPQAKFNLTTPSFHCPQCKHSLLTWQMLPLISYIWLRGKCFYCNHRISWRYPIVEIFSAVLAVLTFYYFPAVEAWMVMLFNSCLLLLIIFDIEYRLLVDVITIPLIWLGLFVNTLGVFTDSKSAILGAMMGYGLPWLVGSVYRYVRKIEGIGYGDFKLLAAIGAWLGVKWLVIVLLSSTLLSFIIVFAITTIKRKEAKWFESFSFGPYAIVVSWIMVFWGSSVVHYLVFLGGRFNIPILGAFAS
ncbi:MAG: hypothetical protein AMJ43_05545 [Coxiella sp. DG_40]|nr:MAG: hypothetical protein AMJ43_05545 [Coxiella sp. DG_40]